MFHRFQPHFIGKCLFTGQQIFPLTVAVHHDDGGGIVVHLADEHGHGRNARHAAGSPAPMSCDKLITALFAGTGDGGSDHAVFRNAFRKGAEFFVISELERMSFEWVQLVDGDLRHPLAPIVLQLTGHRSS